MLAQVLSPAFTSGTVLLFPLELCFPQAVFGYHSPNVPVGDTQREVKQAADCLVANNSTALTGALYYAGPSFPYEQPRDARRRYRLDLIAKVFEASAEWELRILVGARDPRTLDSYRFTPNANLGAEVYRDNYEFIDRVLPGCNCCWRSLSYYDFVAAPIQFISALAQFFGTQPDSFNISTVLHHQPKNATIDSRRNPFSALRRLGDAADYVNIFHARHRL
jgi:hypothetical protein